MDLKTPCRLLAANLKNDALNSLKFVRPDPLAEGLVLAALRIAWIPFVIYHLLLFLPFMALVGCLLLLPLAHLKWDEARASGFFYLLVDIYIFVWTAGLMTAYAICYNEVARQALSGRNDWTTPSVAVPLAVAALRLYELWSFLGCLHGQRKYSIYNVRRAIINTFWHYVEAIFAFATLYLGVALRFGDPFSSTARSAIDPGGIAAHWINPLYFSAISIATVGFGDFAPQTIPAKGLVIAQVFFGVFLLVIILQRAMSSEEMITHAPENSVSGDSSSPIPY